MDILQTQIHEGILVLRLNRPEKHNSLNQDLILSIERAVIDAKSNASIRSLLLIGNGPSFCAGADINRLAECDALLGHEFAKAGQALMNQMESLTKPCLAALHGHVLGGGCELAMSAHLRFAHEKTLLGQPEIKLGVIPGYGGTQRLSRLIGASRALDLCLSGRFIDATTALSWGLVNRVVADDLETEAINYLKQLNQMPSVATSSIIESILLGSNMTLSQGLELEALHFAKTCASQDKQEGVQAFLEKRKAQFKGC
jgi:enoyl-CoA hydratase